VIGDIGLDSVKAGTFDPIDARRGTAHPDDIVVGRELAAEFEADVATPQNGDAIHGLRSSM